MINDREEALAYLSNKLDEYHKTYTNSFEFDNVARKIKLARLKEIAKEYSIPFRYEFYNSVFQKSFCKRYGLDSIWMFDDDWNSSTIC